MPEDVILRAEYEHFLKAYEVRHGELRLEIKEVEQDIHNQIASLDNKIDSLENKLETLSNQMNKRSLDIWKLLATSSVSLIVGYLLSVLTHFVR